MEFFGFQDGGRRHLGFLIFRIFNGRTVKMFEMLHRAKFGQNRLKRGRDMAIFLDF